MIGKVIAAATARTLLAVVIGSFAVLGLAPAVSSGSGTARWTPAAGLKYPRHSGHTATLLADGKVLIAGGSSDGTALASGEVFDPVGGVWSEAAPMADQRLGHGAAMLPGGRVLVAGGFSGGRPLSSVEIYDPRTDSWSPAAPMTDARYGHTATSLRDGTVLVAGGLAGGHLPLLRSAEIYDPTERKWRPAGLMPDGRAEHTATVLTDGRVLVAGGRGAAHNLSLKDAAIFDPANGSWVPASRLMETNRGIHSATLLRDGKVLITGGTRRFTGYRPENLLRSSEVFDARRGRFASAPSLLQARFFHTATLLRDGRVLVAGGYGIGAGTGHADQGLSSAEIYDPVRRRWMQAAEMLAAPGAVLQPGRHTATLLEKPPCGARCNAVLVVGGADSSAQLFNPAPKSIDKPDTAPSRPGATIGAALRMAALVGAVAAVVAGLWLRGRRGTKSR